MTLVHCRPGSSDVAEQNQNAESDNGGTICDGAERVVAGQLFGRVGRDETRLYWMRDSNLESVAKDGTDLRVLGSFPGAEIGGVDQDWVYLTDPQYIVRVSTHQPAREPAAREQLYDGKAEGSLGTPNALRLDGENLYFVAGEANGALAVMPKGGGTLQKLQENFDQPYGMAITPEWIYVSDSERRFVFARGGSARTAPAPRAETAPTATAARGEAAPTATAARGEAAPTAPAPRGEAARTAPRAERGVIEPVIETGVESTMPTDEAYFYTFGRTKQGDRFVGPAKIRQRKLGPLSGLYEILYKAENPDDEIISIFPNGDEVYFVQVNPSAGGVIRRIGKAANSQASDVVVGLRSPERAFTDGEYLYWVENASTVRLRTSRNESMNSTEKDARRTPSASGGGLFRARKQALNTRQAILCHVMGPTSPNVEEAGVAEGPEAGAGAGEEGSGEEGSEPVQTRPLPRATSSSEEEPESLVSANATARAKAKGDSSDCSIGRRSGHGALLPLAFGMALGAAVSRRRRQRA